MKYIIATLILSGYVAEKVNLKTVTVCEKNVCYKTKKAL
jgi:hypothetical protein